MQPEHKEKFLGTKNERLVQFCYQYLKNNDIDYFIFAHRHLPLEIPINHATYFNTGDWINHNTYIQYNAIPVLCRFE